MKTILITEKQARNLFGKKFLRERRDDIFNQERTPLTEAYYVTYPIGKVIDYVKKHFYLSDDYQTFVNDSETYQGFIGRVKVENGEEEICVVFPNGEYQMKKLNQAMSLCGFYESYREKIGEIGDVEYLQIYFEKRHQDNITEKIREHYRFLYHVTVKEKGDKICRTGLTPKACNKRSLHPERIYLIPSNSPIPSVMHDLYRVGKMLYPDREDFIVCGVNICDLKCDFYYDPNAANSIYMTENISPDLLTIKDIVIKKSRA